MFDRWLRTTLRQRFDQTLEEPVPDELAAILADTADQREEH